jgi:ACT domain-containing protein
MAHNKKKLIDESLNAIEKYKLFFIEDVVAYISCCKATFYKYKLNEIDAIKQSLENNKINIKVSMRNKWYKSESATLQIALMKIIATEDEAHRLNGSRQEIKHNANVNISKLSNEAKKKIDDILNNEY